jgi:hypothetical protein
MVDVGGNNHAPGSDFTANQFSREILSLRNEFHFARDLALTGVMDLGPDGMIHARGCPLIAIHNPIIGWRAELSVRVNSPQLKILISQAEYPNTRPLSSVEASVT